MPLAELDVAVRCFDSSDDGGRGPCVYAEVQPEIGKRSLDPNRVRMLSSKSDQHAALRQARGWMLGLSPVDEEWDASTLIQRGRDGEMPRQQHAIWTAATSGLYLTQVETLALRVLDDCFEVRPFRGPRDQPGRLKLVDAEAPRPVGLRLVWIRSNDLQVCVITQPDQRVASAPARVLTSRRRAHTEEPFDLLYASREIGCCKDKVVDLREYRCLLVRSWMTAGD